MDLQFLLAVVVYLEVATVACPFVHFMFQGQFLWRIFLEHKHPFHDAKEE